MKKIIIGILGVMLSAVTSQAVYAKPVGEFVKVEGRVDITRPGQSAEPANVGTEIFEKDVIRSKSDSKAEILFVDGNVLRLAQKTRVEVSEYISDSDKRSTILNLFRGKIQNKVKKLFGGVFGDDENRYEVHTPTSVCGVRGTDFFMSYQKGVSMATFKEGFGYAYNKNQPDNIIAVQAGQSIVIPGSNAAPMLRAASQAEIDRLEEEATPAEDEGEVDSSEDEGDTGDAGGFSPGEELEDSVLAGGLPEDTLLMENLTIDNIDPEFNDPYIPPEAPVSEPNVKGKLMGIVYGTNYEGEYILPRATDPNRSGFTGKIEAGMYHYEYFQTDDDIFLRGSAEEEISDTDTWTMYNYLPDGILITETGGDEEVTPQTTEDTWSGSLAFLATPPAGYYLRHENEYTVSMITGIGDFSGDLTVPSPDLWSATESVPVEISFTGQYISPGTSISMFKSQVSDSFTEGGAYSGVFSGDEAGAEGFIHALYINSDGSELGILRSEFTGLVDDEGVWNSTMYPAVMSTSPGTVTSDNFLSSIGSGYLEVERLTGSFSGASEVNVKAHGIGNTAYIAGNDWGIFDLIFAYAEYDETALSSTWSGSVIGFGEFGDNDGGMWFADITNGEWGTNGITGILNGEFLTMTKRGTIEGNLMGPEGLSGDWAAVSQGSWQKTDDLLFSSRLDGSLYFVRPEEGGSWSSASESNYSYHYDLYSHQGGYHLYNAVDGTNTYMQINAWDFDGAVADFYSQKWVYNHASLALVDYSSDPAPGFVLQSLEDAPSVQGITWDSNNSWTNYNMFNSGWFEGILGGLDSPWTATMTNPADITLLGFYEAPFYITSDQPVIFAIDTESQYSSSGAYSGFMGGVLASSTSGNISAIYVDPGNNAGVLFGDFQGSADRESGIWAADGSIYPVELATGIGVTPATLMSGIITREYHFWDNDSGAAYQEGEGGFIDSNGAFDVGGGNFLSRNISGQPWGVWQNVIGGAYTGTSGSSWTMNIRNEMWDETGNVSGIIAKYGVTGGTWSGNRIDADVLGAWVDLSDVVVGVSSGKIAGTYDPTEMTWQTAGSGVWLKVNQFIDMAATASGRTALTELNIPAIEIGRTTLSGSGSTISVTMTDVAFFAYSTGGDPQIWATDNISGTYSVTPYVNDYVYMSNSDRSVTADFTLKKWDNNNWAADISNGVANPLNRTDVAGTVTVNFDGVAGGTYTGTSTGSFTGEGAGAAR